MLKTFYENIDTIHAVSGIRLEMSEEFYKELTNYIELSDDLFRRISLTVYSKIDCDASSEEVELEQKRKDLSNYGVMMRKIKMEKETWFRYKGILKQLNAEKFNNKEEKE